MTPELTRTIAFLQAIGLPVTVCEHLDKDGFFERVRVKAGGLLIQPDAATSDVLHEAGHLAVVPRRFRSALSDNVDEGIEAMMEKLDWDDPDEAECRAALQCGETEATAWAWAAGIHLNLVPEQIIADSDYDGAGEVNRVRLANDAYLGINGLCHAGFCGRGELGRRQGKPIYPKLAFWLQGGPAS